jgi:hypothetical protein
MASLVAGACFLPGRAKDLSAPLICVGLDIGRAKCELTALRNLQLSALRNLQLSALRNLQLSALRNL